MAKTVVLTGAGRDSVGIVAKIADVLYQFGCNLLDSSMTLLRGQFAIILMIQLPDDRTIGELKQELVAVEQSLGFTINIRELSDAELEDQKQTTAPYLISVYGADRPGIVAGITKKVAALGGNITDVQTKATSANVAAPQVFVMLLEVAFPPAVSAEILNMELTAASQELGMDLSVRQMEVHDL